MAHAIDTTTGKAAVFTTGEKAWHGLGINVADAQTSDEAIKIAGLDWDVIPCPMTTIAPNGQTIEIPNRIANMRSDTGGYLGVVGKQYRVFQNREAFAFMDAIVGEKLAMFETAGAINEGRRVWMLARLPHDLRATKDDIVRPYILLTNSHDGTRALRMIPTSIRVVCANTLNLALDTAASGEGLSINHWPRLDQCVAEARQKLNIVTRRFETFGTEIEAMAGKKVRSNRLASYIEQALELDRENVKAHEKRFSEVMDLMDADTNTLGGMRGTVWSAYNAVSEWADHKRTIPGKTDAAKENARMNSIFFGAAHRIKQRAYKLALELVG